MSTHTHEHTYTRKRNSRFEASLQSAQTRWNRAQLSREARIVKRTRNAFRKTVDGFTKNYARTHRRTDTRTRTCVLYRGVHSSRSESEDRLTIVG